MNVMLVISLIRQMAKNNYPLNSVFPGQGVNRGGPLWGSDLVLVPFPIDYARGYARQERELATAYPAGGCLTASAGFGAEPHGFSIVI